MKTKQVIEVSEWDALVRKTYGRPYNLQQQDGCMSRGTVVIAVPSDANDYDYEREIVPEKVNAEEKGVSFAAWLARDPKQKLSDPDAQKDYCLGLWWDRNFYPALQMVANDLHAKGLLAAGEHTILIEGFIYNATVKFRRKTEKINGLSQGGGVNSWFTHKGSAHFQGKTPLESDKIFRTPPENDLIAARHFWRETKKDCRSMLLMFRLALGRLLSFYKKRTIHPTVGFLRSWVFRHKRDKNRSVDFHSCPQSDTPKARSSTTKRQ